MTEGSHGDLGAAVGNSRRVLAAVLFDPAAHERLSESRWYERRARAEIERIVQDTIAAYRPGEFWPRHPLDVYDSPSRADKGLWIGAAGVLWALDQLGAGVGEASVFDAYLEDPDFPGSTGLMMGETGVALASWKLAPATATEKRLLALVEGNLANPSNELFNGASGSLLAGLHLYEATGSERWRDVVVRCADAVWDQFRSDPELGCRIWIQYRRGRMLRSIGAGHGFASNVRALLRAQELLSADRFTELKRAATETAKRLAMHEDGLVNWPTAADAYWANQFPIRVQWCHGAPGIITSLFELPRDEQLDDLLWRAGELIWRAGPLAKGAGICHGTAGGGYAFLALHHRFRHDVWLERAHSFAAHAIDQLAHAEQPRYSLWTGDLGVALYLRACLDGFDGVPSIDML